MIYSKCLCYWPNMEKDRDDLWSFAINEHMWEWFDHAVATDDRPVPVNQGNKKGKKACDRGAGDGTYYAEVLLCHTFSLSLSRSLSISLIKAWVSDHLWRNPFKRLQLRYESCRHPSRSPTVPAAPSVRGNIFYMTYHLTQHSHKSTARSHRKITSLRDTLLDWKREWSAVIYFY